MILVNGCSHVEGTGLHEDYELTRQMTWPNYVWTSTQIKNIAEPGSSNDNICRRTLAALEESQYSAVCVQWAIFERIEVQTPFYERYSLRDAYTCLHSRDAFSPPSIEGNPEFLHEIAESIFIKQFDYEWFVRYNLAQILILQTYLQQRNIPYVFVMTDWPKIDSTTQVFDNLLDKNKILSLSWFEFCKKGGYKKVNKAHYDLQSHREFSLFAAQIIKERNLL